MDSYTGALATRDPSPTRFVAWTRVLINMIILRLVLYSESYVATETPEDKGTRISSKSFCYLIMVNDIP
jgi:hypothetical protein